MVNIGRYCGFFLPQSVMTAPQSGRYGAILALRNGPHCLRVNIACVPWTTYKSGPYLPLPLNIFMVVSSMYYAIQNIVLFQCPIIQIYSLMTKCHEKFFSNKLAMNTPNLIAVVSLIAVVICLSKLHRYCFPHA